ncbi:carbon starvation CstA family protein [Vulcanisaeta sp. JCM 14467]
MMPAWAILAIAAVWYVGFYFTYGKFLERRVTQASDKNLTPAHTKFDGIDYVPANKAILYGHHVGAIAGTGPIVGPTMAMAWGWLPALLWILIANAIIGAVHDYLALMASVRYEGRSIAVVSERVISSRMRYVFSWYIFFALILILAAFTIFDAQLFLTRPQVATAILFFMPIAIFVGVLIYKFLVPLKWALLIGLSFIVVAIFLGYNVPLVIKNYYVWVTLLLIYGWLAGWLPLWYLLQPRDFMNIYILWAGVIIGAVALIASFATIKIPPVTSFTQILVGYKPSPIWPVIVLVIACGALSGFHSLVASGTSARQLNSELDALFIGYGGMFTEGIVALTVALTVATTLPQSFSMLSSITSWPTGVPKNMYTFVVANTLGAFTQGYGILLHNAFGIDIIYGAIFAGLWFATFDFAVLDTANRLARWTWTDILEPLRTRAPKLFEALNNRYFASLIPLIIAGSLAYTGTIAYVWPAFSGANQLLAALALLTTSSWVMFVLKRPRKASLAILIPALFLWVTVTTALFWYVIVVSYPTFIAGLQKHIFTTMYSGLALTIIASILIILDLYMMAEFINYAIKRRGEVVAAKK